MRTRRTICLATILLSWSAAASAAIIQFQEENLPSAAYTAGALDIRSSSSQADMNREFTSTNGAVAGALIGRVAVDGTDDIRYLLFFDISAIPAGSTINSVALTLFGGGPDSSSVNQDFAVNLHELTGSIIESGATFNTAGPSWNSRDVNGPVAWTTAGGDFSGTVLSSLTANPTTIVADDPYVFGSTTDFVSAAQNALDGSGTFYMLARATSEDTASRGLFRFRSDDPTSTPSHLSTANPLLTVDYTVVPEPQAFVLIAIGMAGLGMLQIRRRK